MACAVGTFDDVTPLGRSAFRWRRSRGFICGVVGAGFLTSTWLIATFATMHSIATPYSPSDRLAEVGTVPKVAPSPRHERLIHVGKADRLAAFDAKPAIPLTASLIQSHAEKTAAAATALAALTKNSRLTMAAEQPVVAAISDSVKFRKDDVIAPPVELASAETDEDDGDRIIVPSKEAVAAAELPALLALADAGSRQIAPAPVEPTASPVKTASIPASEPAPVVVAAADDAPPFDLVLAPDEGSVPLPMARPDGLIGKPALASKGSQRAGEPALAYAQPNSPIEDDEDDAVPRYDKPVFSPKLRAGVAIYDIENSTVYLPNGERLEAHSGLGKMRDNPRYVNKKMRGPTPPHTYVLTVRESLFHGVEALRLTPVQGSDAIYDRVGLLAHTYMLGKNGDSNGCVSFKDYRRFLAAYKRGDIKQLVVVPRLNNKPSSTFASLFSSRS
ncbi:tlde1 domain-containing protein [Rhizobium ruizarguesonis]